MRIIDRDIAFYEGEVERAKDDLARAPVALEPIVRRRQEHAEAVVSALATYRTTLDRSDTNCEAQ